MRITNIRRSRIYRIAGICAILLVLVYALHSWSSANVGIDTNEINQPEAQKSYYKFHRNVYPTLNTGK